MVEHTTVLYTHGESTCRPLPLCWTTHFGHGELPCCADKVFAFGGDLDSGYTHQSAGLPASKPSYGLCQGKHDVHAYAQRARYLVSNIVTNPIDESTKVVTFTKGLNDGPVKAYIFREYPSTFEAAVALAMQKGFSQRQAKLHVNAPRPMPRPVVKTSGCPEPMDLSSATAAGSQQHRGSTNVRSFQQGFTKGTMATTKRALAKVTMGWNQVYEYELWVMDHGAGVDVVLRTDFMIPAGVRLDLFHATARLPDEVEIPLIKTQRMADTREEGPHVPDGPAEVLNIPGHESRDYRPMRQPPTNETHELWVQRTKKLIPKVVEFRRCRPRRVRVTNISDRLVTCPVHLPLLLWVTRGGLLRTEGYVRLGSDKYNEWRVLAYSRSRDADLYKAVLQTMAGSPTISGGKSAVYDSHKDPETTDESSEGSVPDRDDHAVEQQDRVVKVLKNHELIMIASKNALPPPAYGVLCDIDVQEHPPIKQKARRIPLRHLKQLISC
ncbi:unnamed protein product [Phytophthora fragariaefolia]|uniref:Unnamed protein product n=1 Tax=Phytophthora fragariaefolia TaxID=1490495 RepID=A0A9W6XR59_9STRA|nr:unnamed protein product [Phytophthora fragariaefolia]